MLQCRFLGDAVILTGLIEAIAKNNPSSRIDVFTNKKCFPIFKNNPLVHEIYIAEFPIGSVSDFGIREALQLFKSLFHLRSNKYTKSINIFGDFRENLLGWIISSRGNTSLIWDLGNPFRNLQRTGLTRLVPNKVTIEADAYNIYDAVSRFGQYFGASGDTKPQLYDSQNQKYRYTGGKRVGLHLGASLECRKWPIQKWQNLANKIRHYNRSLFIFGAPSERHYLENIFNNIVEIPSDIITGSYDDFFDPLTKIDALVCLDSFASHAAYAVGAPMIIINGANLSEIWRPPGSVVVDGGRTLSCHPCFNSPNCESGERPYACIRDINTDEVFVQLLKLMSAKHPSYLENSKSK